jgi:RNA polymerase sigma-70 factor, ECF subfamily
MRGVGMTVHPGFRDLYEQEFARVYRAVYLLAGDRQLAEDATQEAFARALSRWSRLVTHPAPAAWVTTTALNVARRQLRRRPDIPPVDRVTAAGEDRVALVEAVRALPPRQQEAVALHYLLDLNVADTAVAMGVDEGTVKTHLSRARGALARTLADPAPDPTEELTP